MRLALKISMIPKEITNVDINSIGKHDSYSNHIFKRLWWHE